MATFLDMCATVMRESGLSGSVTSVLNQSGVRLAVVEAVANADISIQGEFTNWKFLWAEWSKTLDIGANSGLFNEYDPPADIGEFITESGAVKLNGNSIYMAEYERVRAQAASVATGTPSIMVLMPSGTVRMTPIPVAADVLTAEYYRAPQRMTANTSESLIPAKFTRAIETLAIANMCAFNEDWENFKLFTQRHAEEMIKLESSQLLGQSIRTNSSNSDNAVIVE